MPSSRRARITRTAISPRLAMRTFPNILRSSLPSSNRTRGTLRASCVRAPRARAGPRASSGCGSESFHPPVLSRAVSPVPPRWPRPLRALGPARSSKRDVSVLAGRALGALGPDHLERFDQVRSRLARVYDVVYVAHLRGDHRVVELLLVVRDELGAFGLGIFRFGDLAPEDDPNRRRGAHDRDLSGRPRDVDVRPDVLGAHDVVGTAVGFPGYDRHLGHRRLGEGVEELGPVADDPTPLLVGARQKAGHVHEREKGDVERVAEAHEPRPLDARVYVERAGQDHRLVAYHPDGVPVEPGEAYHQVLRPAFLHFVELSLVHDEFYSSPYIVGLLRRVRHEVRQLLLHAFRGIHRLVVRGHLQVVLREEGEEVAHVREAGLLVGGGEMGYPAPGVVGAGSPEVLEGDLLTRDALYD